MEKLKTILLVDDSEIDREILKSIFADEFDVLEVDNGYAALDIILRKNEHLDAILLDISMPILDGLNVLRILREKNYDGVPVFMITAEATKDNIEQAMQYGIAEFIRKPYEREDILKRVRSKLGVTVTHHSVNDDIEEIRRYATDLSAVYDRYLEASGEDKWHLQRREDLMRLLLEKYPIVAKGTKSDEFRIEVISKAAYFCDIGYMLLYLTEDEKTDLERMKQHTALGAALVHLNYADSCNYFVQACAEMCLRHHERYDGQGFPEGLSGDEIPEHVQLCGLLDRFDTMFFKLRERHEHPFDLVIDDLQRDRGRVSSEIFQMLAESRHEIVSYYTENYI